MKNLIKTDIGYFVRSKVFMGLAILFGFFMLATSWMTYQFNCDSLREYNNMHKYLLSINANEEDEKEVDYIIHDDGVIENPLSYDIEQVENALSYIVPNNNFMLFGESCTLFLPIIACLVGIALVSYDDKNKTLKLKVANYGKIKLDFSKQISGIIILLLLMIIAFIIIKVSTSIMYSKIKAVNDISAFNISIVNWKETLGQVVFTLCSALVYFEIGYCISNIFHCYTILAATISVISFFLPALFKHDFVNSKNTLERVFFKFKGVVSIGDGFPLSVEIAALEIISFTLICIIANQVVFRKRSAYA